MASFTVHAGLNAACTVASDTLTIVLGKARNLRSIKFEGDLKAKLGEWISPKLWADAISAIPSAGPSAAIPLYLNLAKLIVLSDEVSRHNAPSNSLAIFKEIKNVQKPESTKKISVLLYANWADVFASVAAISRCFPLFDCHTSGKPSLESVDVEVAVVEESKALSRVDIVFLQRICDAVRTTARLVDMPCLQLHTVAFLEEAKKLVGDFSGVKTQVIWGEDLLEQGFGGIYHVGKGATHLPVFACFSYEPEGAISTYALVGKGIVYDTGGLSLKGHTTMPGMKIDMGGAAALLSAFRVLVQSSFKQNLHCILCIAENMIAPNALRPDDVITMLSGKTVEVNNTDCEGRLVLADGVFYAKNILKANTIIDMATLTAAQGQATGKFHAAVMCSNEDWEKRACAAGKISGDLVHPLPFCPDLHFGDLKSPVADMRNTLHGKMQGPPSCLAGLFVASHIDFGKDVDWVHFDIAYPVENGDRATGYGPSLICALLGNDTDIPLLKN